jgi:A/G-specific adenine glycosylase
VCTARAARCGECPVRSGCSAARAGGPVIAPRAAAGSRTRFEDTDRFLRGRVVAALLAGEALPEGAARVLDGLARDGLIALDHRGRPRLPATRMRPADFDLVLEDPSGP